MEKNNNIHTLSDYNSDDDELTYEQVETLYASTTNKVVELANDNSKLRAENKVVKEYLNKSVNKNSELKNDNDILKVKLSKYEPKSSSNENKKIIKEYHNKFSGDEEWLNNLKKEQDEVNEKAFRDFYASKYSFLE